MRSHSARSLGGAFSVAILLVFVAAQAAGQNLAAGAEPASGAPQAAGSPGTDQPAAVAPVPDVGTASAGGSAAGNPFDTSAFDQTVQTSMEAPTTAKTSYLAGGSALVEAQAYAPASFDRYFAESSAQGKVFGKVSDPQYGQLYASFAYAHTFLEAQSGYGLSLPFGPADLSSVSLSLAELHYSFDLAKILFVRLGNQLLAWGPSRIWTPVDLVNLQHINPFLSVDTRIGRSGLYLHVPFRSSDIFLFTDLSETVANGLPQDLAATAREAARYNVTLGDFELGLTGYAGENVQGRGGFDFSGNLAGTAVYGAPAFAPAYSSYGSFWSASLGFDRKLGDLKRWTLSGEFFYQSNGADYTGQSAVMALLPSLYMGAYYGYVSLEADELFSSYLNTTLYALANLSDGSYSLNLKEDFSLPRAVPFSLMLSYAGGGEGKEFTYLFGNGVLGLSIQTLFSF
jgi:hypothetical protein